MGMSASGGSSSRRGRNRSRGAVSEINVTPLVDVMLVLLVIFMVTAPMLTAGVTVDLPETKAAPLPGSDEPLSVSVQSDGSVYIQETKVTLETLGARLKAITQAAQAKDVRVIVRGDKRIGYGKMMQVVGEINDAGFTKIALMTDVES